MAAELLIRFVIGGVVVSLFAVVGDLFKPKTFSGIFGGAPSVALATLALTAFMHPSDYVAAEGKTMILGAIALAAYALVVARLLTARPQGSAWAPALASWAAWGAVAFGLYGIAMMR